MTGAERVARVVTPSSFPTHAHSNTYRKRDPYDPRRPKRVADLHLHMWPNLAFKCEVCGWPVDKVTYPVHPGCEAAA